MIGCWRNPVVRLSVCLMLCIMTLRVGVQAKICTSVFLADMFLFVASDTFVVGYIVWPRNAPRTKLVEDNASMSFL